MVQNYKKETIFPLFHRFINNFALMNRNIEMICLRTVKYSDSAAVLTVFSRQCGRMAFIVPAGNGRTATRIRAITQPLCIVEGVADIKPGRDLHRISEIRQIVPLGALQANPLKCAIALFLAEITGIMLREGMPDENTWQFLSHAVTSLEALPKKSIANFHLWFLYRLGDRLGVKPDSSTYSPGRIFDINDGIFRNTAPLHTNYVGPQQAREVALLDRMTIDNLHAFKLTRDQRNEILDGMLRYLSLHYAPIGTIKSLDVLRALF